LRPMRGAPTPRGSRSYPAGPRAQRAAPLREPSRPPRLRGESGSNQLPSAPQSFSPRPEDPVGESFGADGENGERPRMAPRLALAVLLLRAFGAAQAPHVLALPELRGPVTVDGRIDAAEWVGAA